MKRSLMSCLPVKRRIQFFIFRLKHWKDIKNLMAKIEHDLIYGTSDIEPKGILSVAEEEK